MRRRALHGRVRQHISTARQSFAAHAGRNDPARIGVRPDRRRRVNRDDDPIERAVRPLTQHLQLRAPPQRPFDILDQFAQQFLSLPRRADPALGNRGDEIRREIALVRPSRRSRHNRVARFKQALQRPQRSRRRRHHHPRARA